MPPFPKRNIGGSDARWNLYLHILQTFFMENNLWDIQPHKLYLAWYNGRTGDAYIGKRLDRFILHEQLLESLGKVHSRVPNIAISEHCPIILN